MPRRLSISCLGQPAPKSAANSNPSLLCMGLFSIFFVRGMQKPSPGDGRGLRYVIRSRDPQVFFSIGQALFSSGMKASAAGMVATRL
jgi:hypothetical protein